MGVAANELTPVMPHIETSLILPPNAGTKTSFLQTFAREDNLIGISCDIGPRSSGGMFGVRTVSGGEGISETGALIRRRARMRPFSPEARAASADESPEARYGDC